MLAQLGDVIYWAAALASVLVMIVGFIFAIADFRTEGMTGVFAASGAIATIVFLAGRVVRGMCKRLGG
jgi:hypothetical protein